ncbi:unnamed protein product [Prorocentrum cordatum]|uniref:Uncharacterized protein n=1 Tax=Prorocentrum cordatum TaxID=2364126 RepID=A0ABN9PTQ2_9DINO|nr:unnamed protein product [Polarella glacialis]|mmetsp:Transcript_81834/g.213536  ORF Transcript_81834/g.213536 Transcript_81834/m.213536 type:complete len:106 (-) Transcript_81834:299-616(-)
MRLLPAALAWAALAGGAGAARVLGHHPMDNHRCKVTCQRFGMKALGPAFVKIRHPNECVKKCDDVYPSSSLVQLGAAPPASMPAAAAPPAQPKGGAPAGAAPVRR